MERSTSQRRAKVSAEVRLAAQSAHIRGTNKVEHSEAKALSVSTDERASSPQLWDVHSEASNGHTGSISRVKKSTAGSTQKKNGKTGGAPDAEDKVVQLRLQAALEESLSMAKEAVGPAKKRMKTGKHDLGDEEPMRGVLDTQRLGVASWVGDSTERKGLAYYDCFAKNGHYINVGDCVYVKPEEKDQVSYIMRVRSMWASENGEDMLFRGQWLYRPQDTKAGMDAAVHPREVLLSDWEDDNPVACVQTKCHVAFLDGAPDSSSIDAIGEERVHFVCWRSYNVTSGRIRDSLQESKEASAEEQACKKLVAQDRVRALERELWAGMLEIVRVRRADGQWARKVLQEAAHMLSEAMPTMPIPHITKLVLSHETESLVLYKGKEVWAATTVRHRAAAVFMEVELLAVKTSKQRTGFGALLVHRLCLLCKEYGYRWMLTSADDTAVPFFKANGFTSKITVPKKDYIGVITAYEHSLLMQHDVSLSTYGSRNCDDSALFTSSTAVL